MSSTRRPFVRVRTLFLVAALVAASWNTYATTRALLIGVSGYPNLSPAKRLAGPANDVSLMYGALLKAGLQQPNITVLADGVSNSLALPTRTQILDQMRALADRSQPDDWAIVYFSGHGSQQPQPLSEVRRPGAYIEPDGLDEIFLPYDVGQWNSKSSQVQGALIDDEIAVELDYFRRRGVKVWAIFDTCHAGDMAKSIAGFPTGNGLRFIDPAELGVPSIVLEESKANAKARQAGAKTWNGFSRQAGRSIAPVMDADRQLIFYASQPDEPAAEEPLAVPAGFAPSYKAGDRRYFGLFTYLIALELPKWRGDFAELAGRVREVYSSRPYPTPSFEGNLSIVPNFRPSALTFGAKVSP